MILSCVIFMAFAQIYFLLTGTVKPTVLSATTTLTVEDRLSSLEKRMTVVEKYTGMIKSKPSAVAKENFLSINGGTMDGADWSKVLGSDFTMDQNLYGNVTEVTWQGWMDNGYGYARLYDGTNHRAVDGSEVLISSGQKTSFYSKAISIWRGQNQYWIEVRSMAGPVTISSPRLRILVN